ncbi:MAG: patatin-like phospholipase family protein [Candidatus Promineifilaceae bacterium]
MAHPKGESPVVGLALGGGAVRGLAHVGVLETLIRAETPIQVVAGCSVGAIVGALYCAAFPIERWRELRPALRWRRMIQPVRPESGLFSLDKLGRWLTMMIGDLEFADLHKPLAVVTADAGSGERVVLQEGRLAPAVQANCSIPGILTPVEIEGRLLADGGIVENLPVATAQRLGAAYVVAVDVFEPTYRRRLGPLGPGLAAIETLVHHAGDQGKPADLLVEPALRDQSFVRFSRSEELARRGRTAAEAALPQLRADLGLGPPGLPEPIESGRS